MQTKNELTESIATIEAAAQQYGVTFQDVMGCVLLGALEGIESAIQANTAAIAQRTADSQGGLAKILELPDALMAGWPAERADQSEIHRRLDGFEAVQLALCKEIGRVHQLERRQAGTEQNMGRDNDRLDAHDQAIHNILDTLQDHARAIAGGCDDACDPGNCPGG
jgi:hypothetical protein